MGKLPKGVSIKNLTSVAVPVQSMAGQVQMSVQVYGNGDDNKVYAWDGKQHEWVLV
jgi:hypothetical protein